MPLRSSITRAACGLWSQSELYKVAYCLSVWINPNSELALSACRDVVSITAWYLSPELRGVSKAKGLAHYLLWCFFVSNIFMYVKSFEALCIF